MKRLLLALSLVAPLALSRAGARAEQADAYGSLVGMADSASSDKGPDAGEVPPDQPHRPDREDGRAGPGAARDARTGFGVPAGARSAAKPYSRATAVKREAAKDDGDAPSVSVPEAAAPRVWTKVFSSLLPPVTRTYAFEVVASSASRRDRPETGRPATTASAAGVAQGLIELVAAATAPSASAAR